MKQKLKAIFKGPVVFHPPLLAAFPVLFLYAYNINETPASQMWLSLIISVAASLVLWAVLSLILRSLAKAGLATALFILFFFSYGHLYDALESASMLSGVFVEHALLLPIMLFIWGYCVYFIGRAKRDFRIATKIHNIVAVALIAINLFNIVSYQVKVARLGEFTPTETSGTTAASPAELNTLPDIYFIIMDEYGHPDTMKDWYDYDNSEFFNSLEDKGFFIASGSETQIMTTPLIIAQILNMEYLDYEPWSEATYRKIADNQVANFLKAQGYQFIAFGNDMAWYTWEKYAKDTVDLYLAYYGYNSSNSMVNEFVHILWNTTMLRPFYFYVTGSTYEHSYRGQTLYMLEKLKELPELEGPKFVFAHVICPHVPYVFGPNGEHIDTENWANHADKQFYLGQYIFISAEIEKVIDVLLDESEIPPIIVIQSDHGIRPIHHGIVIGENEWRKILNVMYLPGMDTEMLDEDISPVNTFRLIFNQYFDADYPLLEDNQE